MPSKWAKVGVILLVWHLLQKRAMWALSLAGLEIGCLAKIKLAMAFAPTHTQPICR